MSCGFPRSTGRADAEFIPIVTIVADEVGDFVESLVHYDVWEGHGSGMGGDSGGGGGDPLCI